MCHRNITINEISQITLFVENKRYIHTRQTFKISNVHDIFLVIKICADLKCSCDEKGKLYYSRKKVG